MEDVMFRELTDSELSQVSGGGNRNRQRIVDSTTGDNKFKLIAPHADEVNVINVQNSGNFNIQDSSVSFET
jgi:bacteriocin-like protein